MATQLRGNLTKKMEDGAGKVHFSRWKAMSIGARISLVVLVAVVLIACFANFIAPHDPLAIYTARQAPDGEFLIGQNGKLNPNATLGRVVIYKGRDYLLTPDDWEDVGMRTGLRQEYNFSVSAANE